MITCKSCNFCKFFHSGKRKQYYCQRQLQWERVYGNGDEKLAYISSQQEICSHYFEKED